MFKNIISFIKNPVWEVEENTTFTYCFGIIWKLIWLNILISITVMLPWIILDELGIISIGNHFSNDLDEYSLPLLFFVVSIFAPVIEEVLFRAPLFFYTKSNNLKYAYYISSLLFGAIHIFNFELTETDAWVIPFLMTPQLVSGFLLGYVTIKLGLLWSIFMHSLFNTILFLPEIISRFLA